MNQEEINKVKEEMLRSDISKLQDQQQQIVTEFNNTNTEIQNVLAEYNAKIAQLEKEGQGKIDALESKREQLRGSHNAIINSINEKELELNKLLGIVSEQNQEVVNNNIETTENNISEATSESVLTEEDIKAVEALQNKSEKEIKENKSEKNDSIPEYLQEGYKK